MKFSLVLLLATLALVSPTQAQDKIADPKSAAPAPDPKLKEKVSYFIGTQIGNDFQKNGIELDLEVFVQAIKDAQDKKQPKYAEAELEAAMQQFQTEMAS